MLWFWIEDLELGLVSNRVFRLGSVSDREFRVGSTFRSGSVNFEFIDS